MAIKVVRNTEHADGKLPISAGSNITLTDTGNTIVISSTATSGGGGSSGGGGGYTKTFLLMGA